MLKSSPVASRLILILLGAVFALGCMTIGDPEVRVESERALIIWDAEKKVEHFIRWTNFRNAKKSFGFIVPSPSVPQVEVVSPKIFTTLHGLIDEATNERDRKVKSGDPNPTARSIEILQVKQVGGYDSVTVRAKDALTLNLWLKKNNFDRDPQFELWAKPYIDRGWVFTAFKLLPQNGAAELEPIRMTFDALEPFYPYREGPASNLDGIDREFTLYFLAKEPFSPVIARKPWAPAVSRLRPLGAEQTSLERDLKLASSSLSGYSGMRYSLASKTRDGIDDIIFVRASASSASVTVEAAARWTVILLLIPLGLVVYRLLRKK